MAEDNFARLQMLLDVTAENLKRELRGADQATESYRRRSVEHFNAVDKAMAKVDSAIGGVGKGLAGLAAGLSVAALGAFIRKTSEMADTLQTTADRLGLNVETLQELQYAAKRTDVDVSALQSSFERFSKRLGEAQAGGGEFLKIAKEYNIALRDGNGTARNAESVFGDLADAVANATTHQEKLRIATQSFGKEGGQLVLLLKNGSAGMQELRDAARDAGVVLGAEGVQRLAAFNDRLDVMAEKSSAAGSNLIIALVPALETAVGWIESATRGTADLISQFLRLENLSLSQLEAKADTIRKKLAITEKTNPSDLFGLNSDMRAELDKIEAQIARIRGGLAAPTSAPLGDLPERTVELTDNLTTLNAELANARKALDVLRTGGTDAFEAFAKTAEIEKAAAAAADQFNRTNKQLIESGQLKARGAADYVDVLTKTAALQDQAADTVKLDAYVAKLTEQYGIARDRLRLGEDEAKITAEINKLREAGIVLSADQEAVIRRTIRATEGLNDQWDANQKAIKAATKAAEDAAADRDSIPDDFADVFAGLIQEAIACQS